MGKKLKEEGLLPGTLEMLILKSLTSEVRHGYGIARHIRQISGAVLQIEEGSLYPALQRLLRQGWVEGEWGRSANNRRARFYRLTPQGRKQLKEDVAGFERQVAAISRVLELA